MISIRRALWLVVVTVLGLVMAFDVRAGDVQFWTVGRAEYPISDNWAGQALVRFRFDEDVSRAKDFMLRVQPHRQLGPFDFGVGYDYMYSFVTDATIEHRPFQSLEHRWRTERLGPLSIKNRLRIDERFRADATGVIVRLRYRLRLDRRFGDHWYAALSDEVFANVNDRGEGPPAGFEQNRLRTTVGRFVVPGVRGEFGYDWQVAEGRDRDVIHRHVLFVNFFAMPAEYRAGRGD